jgi:DNA-binding IclR family transcriptional regulator
MLERPVRRGCVSRNANDRYELTLKLFGLAHFHRPIRRLVSQAVQALAARTMQSNHLAVYDRAGVTIIAQVDPPGYWGIAIRVGARVSLYNTGSGHVLLAFRSNEARTTMMVEQESSENEARPDDLAERLAQIRQRGYEVAPSQQTAGVYNLSAPVLGGDSTAIAALTCPYIAPLNRPKAPDIPEAIAMVQEAAAALSSRVRGQVAAPVPNGRQ